MTGRVRAGDRPSEHRTDQKRFDLCACWRHGQRGVELLGRERGLDRVVPGSPRTIRTVAPVEGWRA